MTNADPPHGGLPLSFAGNVEGGDLLGRELLGLVAHLHFNVGVAVFAFDDFVGHVLRLLAHLGELPADEALGGENGVARIGHGLAIGGLAKQAARLRRLAKLLDTKAKLLLSVRQPLVLRRLARHATRLRALRAVTQEPVSP